MKEKDAIRENLLKHCRFYNGEDESHYTGMKDIYWSLEKVWVELVMNPQKKEYLADQCNRLLMCGEFYYKKDEIEPDTLRAMLMEKIIGDTYMILGSPEYRETYKQGIDRYLEA